MLLERVAVIAAALWKTAGGDPEGRENWEEGTVQPSPRNRLMQSELLALQQVDLVNTKDSLEVGLARLTEGVAVGSEQTRRQGLPISGHW